MRIEHRDDVAVLHLEGGKANALSPTFLRRLDELLDAFDRSPACAGVLVGYDRFFSAGLALPELIGLDRGALREFVALFGDVMLRVFTQPRPMVAAINGHAIAGGCVLALQCDLRVMTDHGGRIGLNEVALGIGLPTVVIETLRVQVPPSSLLAIAQRGVLHDPPHALALGLVHEIVPQDLLLTSAIGHARALGAHPPMANALVKETLRRPAVQAIAATRDADVEKWLDTWFSAPAQHALKEAVARLAG